MPGIGITIKKNSFGLFIVITDILAVIMIIAFIYILDNRQNEFIKQYNKQTIEMSDYTIRVKGLPADSLYGDKPEILKAQLWTHFENILKKANNFDDYQRQMDSDGKRIPQKYIQVPQSCEVVDITFGKQNFDDTEQLMEMNALYREAEENKIKIDRVVLPEQKDMFYDKMIDCENKYTALKEAYTAKDKDVEKTPDSQSVKYAYIVFRSMEAVNHAIDAYNLSKFYRILYLYIFCCCYRRRKHNIR